MLQDSNQNFSTLNNQRKFEMILCFHELNTTLWKKNIRNELKCEVAVFLPPRIYCAKRNAGVFHVPTKVFHLASSCLKQGSSRMSCHPPKAFFIASRISFFITFRAGDPMTWIFSKSRGSHANHMGVEPKIGWIIHLKIGFKPL